MDLYRLIQALEKLIFEVASWFVFLPFTLAFTLFRPNRIHMFVLEEFKKEPEERFQNRMSPPLFWAIIGVLPAFASIELWRPIEIESFIDRFILPGWAIESKIFALSVALMSGPIAFSAATRLAQGKPLTRSGLQPYFYSQCYVFAPFQLALAVCVLILRAILTDVISSLISLPAAIVGGWSPFESWMLKYGVYLLGSILFVAVSWFLLSECFFLYSAVDEAQPGLRRFLLVVWTFLISVVLWAAMVSVWVFGSEFVIDVVKLINKAALK